jgi:hypothetical protein
MNNWRHRNPCPSAVLYSRRGRDDAVRNGSVQSR